MVETTQIDQVTKVSVTNISMPFGSMVVFMVKWAVATIPALIILAIVIGVIMLFLAAMGAAVS
jgi:hypothetical protein